MVKCIPEFKFLYYLKNRNIISKVKRSKVTDYAALSNLHEKKEYDNYFVISREAVMLATLKTKIGIIYSLVLTHVAKTNIGTPSTKKKKET